MGRKSKKNNKPTPTTKIPHQKNNSQHKWKGDPHLFISILIPITIHKAQNTFKLIKHQTDTPRFHAQVSPHNPSHETIMHLAHYPKQLTIENEAIFT